MTDLISRRRALALSVACFAGAFCAAAMAQQADDGEGAPQQDRDPVTGKVCRPMCAEDMSPCDPPIMKARDGRCASPSAGFVG
ncbi:MAG: hypothetical protein KDJ25_05405 [Rhodoblastus sp.]|nr:hypothetical protein [Rhodoblastus sp.]